MPSGHPGDQQARGRLFGAQESLLKQAPSRDVRWNWAQNGDRTDERLAAWPACGRDGSSVLLAKPCQAHERQGPCRPIGGVGTALSATETEVRKGQEERPGGRPTKLVRARLRWTGAGGRQLALAEVWVAVPGWCALSVPGRSSGECAAAVGLAHPAGVCSTQPRIGWARAWSPLAAFGTAA
ncbi:hypothetical protein NDU88_005555 [Pleurodeles waltl]|uniref:Uncharacterized protein n=1 Tax=Pleurodeles waltl TaxID=8319 RepID=A0AAV7LLI4_PLEWA|nr:hypothetical protein NDU88_005555 [Pleurodeles waltl]